MLTLSDFDYVLPQDRIAQTPAHPRDHSRLMVVNRKHETIDTTNHFYDLPSLLTKNDVLVVNNSKTLPMRTYGTRQSGGKTEVLFVKRLELHSEKEVWEVMTSPGLKPGQEVHFQNTQMHIVCTEDLGYTRKVDVVDYEGSVIEVLHKIGELPTPHYIRKHLDHPEEYQTIYAKPEGSSATPTAGLHFTQSIFDELSKKGIPIIELTLHVGLGTFLPVKTEDIQKHHMHSEWFTLSKKNAEQLNQYKAEGCRIVAVGTTTTRILETCAIVRHDKKDVLTPQTGETSLYLYPPYTFKCVDALITNFHLPKSTLLMLVSAFSEQGKIFHTFKESLIGKAYQQAIKENFRFFSFGDAMVIE
ncbi:MAG TPA: tRNA preQ1(34) S-adenosylmethionine ribosyltransferase-isomerase QueA [Candidatus Pacebacteria bacterium]|nr:MAG: S-adenosylmethionine:tRNA ribosyltransferase-isomerase [Microgenomates group bacterium GW2011_GWB1_45_17]KKU24143.1 MAG: S-adenosylmethionine:tRNA ribosyltransferase-isomerase [Microgenomates group bacterium GW2011_GWC1_46_15]KKU24858.1 MAG: S-adenosylmethionine:tRNA ribosyltransferase-isomerase [Microgenomates group bacterium GW2011_GWA1_46_15]HAV14767.1 tRNA preQ1(34) S-adenosylmethionine ribosyltransferase-isomerase QueA [Candidatus Paceibacterota bacterium]HCR11473.1 tRNA preQ1(34) 